ncbi:hypothetical protein C8R41DRAFT_922095 [Lentinula lateritia]|uniref:Uncharacterized protein n=1 Tax=Lentinula lateritia TaxID=40482 RepID=A0ABQ8VAM1_9AGAR|nr:hypothetical protein C8R41DRAFT_922095 [Lentinula lateritia]
MPCQICATENIECISFYRDTLSADERCICGHQVSDHRMAALSLPPRGGYPKTNCPAFSSSVAVFGPRTLCDQVVSAGHICNSPYMSHAILETPLAPLPDVSTMNTLRASRWVHPADIQKVNTVQTVNGRRMEAAQRNLHMQSGATISPFYHKGAAAKRSARHSYPQNQGFQGYGGGSVQSNAKAKSQDGFKFIVYFLPEMAPIIREFTTSPGTQYHPPVDVAYNDNQILRLFQRLAEYNLAVEVTITDNMSAKAIIDRIVTSLNVRLSELGITIPTPDPAIPQEKRSFYILWGNMRQGKRHYVPNRPGLLNDDWWTFKETQSLANKAPKTLGCATPALIAAPVAGPITWRGHVCCGPKLNYGFITERVDDDTGLHYTDCLQECRNSPKIPTIPLHFHFPPDAPIAFGAAALSPDHSLFDGISTITTSSSSSPLNAGRPFEELALSDDDDDDIQQGIVLPMKRRRDHATNSDEEHEDMAAAIKASMSTIQAEERRRLTGNSTEAGPSGIQATLPPVPNRSTYPSSSSNQYAADYICHSELLDATDMSHKVDIELANTASDLFRLLDQYLLVSGLQRSQRVVITATNCTTEAVADGLITSLINRAGYSLPEPMLMSITLPVQDIELLFPIEVFNLGHGYGSSLPKTLLGCAMERMMSHTEIWRPCGDQHLTLELNRLLSAQAQATLKAFGNLVAMSLVHLHVIPRRLSPSLMLALIHESVDSLDDQEFISFLPALQRILLHWHSNPSREIPNNDVTSEVALAFNCTVADFNTPVRSTVAERASVYKQVIALYGVGLPVSGQCFEDHWAVKAFRSGLNISLASGVNLLDLFGPETKSILKELDQQFPDSGDDLRPYISYDASACPEKQSRVDEFMMKFFRWANRPGHVTHASIAEALPTGEAELYSNDYSFRPRRFLQCATGSEILSNSTKITFIFTSNKLPVYETEGAPARYQACFGEVRIDFNPRLEQLLDQSPGDVEDDTFFDVWLHSTCALSGFSDFETI